MTYSKLTLMGAIAAVSALVGATVAPQSARAGLLVEYSTDNVTFTTLCSDVSGGACAGSVANIGNGIALTIQSASSNSPGSPLVANLLSAVTRLENKGSTTATLYLRLGDTDFAAPIAPPPLTLASQIGGSVSVGSAANLLSYFSCVDPGNGQNFCGGGAFTTASLSPSITGTSSSYNANNSLAINSLAGLYSMTEVIGFTLGGHSILNYSASTDLTPNPVPEPASLALLGVSLAGVGLISRRRRKA